MTDDAEKMWREYCESELSEVRPHLAALGYELDDTQPHLSGERYLMQAATTTSGKKLILLGRKKDSDQRVVIKVTSDANGIREIEHERECRRVLQEIKFAYRIFLSPEELLFIKKGGQVISIQAFIEQESSFLARPIEEQFTLALQSFKAQEGAHATTYEHSRLIKRTFGSMDARKYVATFEKLMAETLAAHPGNASLKETLESAQTFLSKNTETIDQYGSFLTHTDFVPHNFRVVGGDIYLLDHSSLRFGNKYEGWARFLNFMTLYNQPLERALTKYVRENRALEESLSLRLMRVYRLGEIIWYYTNTFAKTSGNLHKLNSARVVFWSEVLVAVLAEKEVEQRILDDYRKTRDSLRSDEEKERQIGLH